MVHEYVDRATGKHGDRDQFQKMFAAASRREFDCLLFWSLDRLSREGTVETLGDHQHDPHPVAHLHRPLPGANHILRRLRRHRVSEPVSPDLLPVARP